MAALAYAWRPTHAVALHAVDGVPYLFAGHQPQHQEDHEQDHRDHKQRDGNVDERTGYAAKSKDGGNKGNDEADKGKFDHGQTSRDGSNWFRLVASCVAILSRVRPNGMHLQHVGIDRHAGHAHALFHQIDGRAAKFQPPASAIIGPQYEAPGTALQRAMQGDAVAQASASATGT